MEMDMECKWMETRHILWTFHGLVWIMEKTSNLVKLIRYEVRLDKTLHK